MILNDLMLTFSVNGYKMTKQRKAILQTLTENAKNLISVETLYNHSKKIYKNTNLSTIYRNIEILDKLNLLYKDMNDDGIAVYKLICSRDHHHHLICKKCGRTEMIDYCPLEGLKNILKDSHFNITDHKLEIYGYCMHCEQDKPD